MKRGEIYRVKNHNHPCVLLQNEADDQGRIDAIILTHNWTGGATLKNILIPRDCFERFDENGMEYPFKWEYTHMVNCIFSKDTGLLPKIEEGQCIGKIKEEYLDKIIKSIDNKTTFDKPIWFLDHEVAKHPEMLIKVSLSD